MSNQLIHDILKDHPLIPVVTFQEKDDPIELMQYLLDRNVSCIEITLRTKCGLGAIEKIKKEYADKVTVGAGTVIHSSQINDLKQIGIDFIVSPGLTNELHKNLSVSGIPYLPGVSTPSEIMKAQSYGLEYLKFFPANLFGGLKAIKTYGGLFPTIKFCPTGGINEETSKEYLKLENVISVGGSWFQKEFNKQGI